MHGHAAAALGCACAALVVVVVVGGCSLLIGTTDLTGDDRGDATPASDGGPAQQQDGSNDDGAAKLDADASAIPSDALADAPPACPNEVRFTSFTTAFDEDPDTSTDPNTGVLTATVTLQTVGQTHTAARSIDMGFIAKKIHLAYDALIGPSPNSYVEPGCTLSVLEADYDMLSRSLIFVNRSIFGHNHAFRFSDGGTSYNGDQIGPLTAEATHHIEIDRDQTSATSSTIKIVIDGTVERDEVVPVNGAPQRIILRCGIVYAELHEAPKVTYTTKISGLYLSLCP